MALQLAYGTHSCAGKLNSLDARMAYMWHSVEMNCALDQQFGKPSSTERYNPLHQAYPLTRSIMSEMRKLYPAVLADTYEHRFRNKAGVIPHYLALWTAVYQGKAVKLKQSQFLSEMIIQFYGHRIFDVPAFKAFQDAHPKPSLVCLGDFTAGKVDTNGKGGGYASIRKIVDAQDSIHLRKWDDPDLKALAERVHNFYQSFVGEPAPWEVS